MNLCVCVFLRNFLTYFGIHFLFPFQMGRYLWFEGGWVSWAISSCTQGLLLPLHSMITPGWLGTLWIPEIDPGMAACKTGVLSSTVTLIQFVVFSFINFEKIFKFMILPICSKIGSSRQVYSQGDKSHVAEESEMQMTETTILQRERILAYLLRVMQLLASFWEIRKICRMQMSLSYKNNQMSLLVEANVCLLIT